MTGEELLDAFRLFTEDAVRLETRQYYEVPGDAERQRAFHEGRALPARAEKSTSVEIIHAATEAGKRIGRIHIIEWPLSDYVRYELEAAYQENLAAGEEILIANRASDPALDALREDFVLFDADTDQAKVVWYRYTEAGEITSWDEGTAADVVSCREALRLARQHSVSLTEFLASTQSREC